METKSHFSRTNFLVIIALSSSTFFSACEAPRDRREMLHNQNSAGRDTIDSLSVNRNVIRNAPNNPSSGTSLPDTATGTPAGPPNENPQNSDLPSEYSHCSFKSANSGGYMRENRDIGKNTICQSNKDSKNFLMQFENPFPSALTCFLPVYKSNNQEIYLGEEQCIRLERPNQAVLVEFKQNRPQSPSFSTPYSVLPLNAVFVARDIPRYYPPPYPRFEALNPTAAFIACSRALEFNRDPSYCRSMVAVGGYFLQEIGSDHRPRSP